MSWKFDAPTGTYRNHALSSDIRREAIADVQFMKFLRAEPGFGKGKGESVTITRVMKLPEAVRVGELERLPSGRPAIETKQVSVSQWGYKVPMTEYEKHLSHFNIMDPIQAALRDQISLTMDTMCASAFKLTPLKYTPLSTGGEFVTDGSADSLCDRNLEIQDLRRIHDRLRGDLKCPAFKNGKYVGILSTRAARGLKNDPERKDWWYPVYKIGNSTRSLRSPSTNECPVSLLNSGRSQVILRYIGIMRRLRESVGASLYGGDLGRFPGWLVDAIDVVEIEALHERSLYDSQ